MYVSWIHGPRIMRAPENDAGHDFEEDLDLDVDTDLEDQDEDQDVLDEDEPDETPEPAARASRGANRVAEATRIAAEAKAEVTAAKAEIERLKAAANPQRQQEQAEDRQRRLAAMSPDQRTDFLLREQEQRFEARLAQTEFATKDTADAAEFRSLCASSPQAAKLAADVEKELATMRAKGQTAPRATILKYLIGDKILAKAPKARQAQVNRAAPGVARNAARPAGGRSDVAGGDRRAMSEAEARRKRLEPLKF